MELKDFINSANIALYMKQIPAEESKQVEVEENNEDDPF